MKMEIESDPIFPTSFSRNRYTAHTMSNKLILLFEKAYSPSFNMVLTIAAARIFGADAVGNLALILIFAALGQYLTSRGTDQNMQVAYASHAAENLAQAARIEVRKRLIRLLFGVLFLTVLYLPLSTVMADPNALFFGLLGAAIGAASACSMPNEIQLIVTQKFKRLVELKYLSGCIALLVGLLLLLKTDLGFFSLVATLILERILYLILTIVTLTFVNGHSGGMQEMKGIPKINIYVLISAAAIFSYNRLDQVYIYSAFSLQELGIYFSTAKLFEVANLLVMAAITSKLHIMADRRRNSAVVVSAERKLLAFSGCLVLGISIAAPSILTFVFGIKPESFSYIYVLAAGTFFGTIGAIKGPWVAKNNRYHFNTYFTIAGGIAAIGILTIFKPDSLSMVAATMAISQLIVNVLCPLMLKDERAYLISLMNWNKK